VKYFLCLLSFVLLPLVRAAEMPSLTLDREQNWLIIRGPNLPGREIRINYLEAYCRPGSTDADWVAHTVIKHTNALVAFSADRKLLQLRDTLTDGVIVHHAITAKADEIDFRIEASNPTSQESAAHWAQPCIRLADFMGIAKDGKDLDDYLPKAFIFLEGKLSRMSAITPWAKQARYTPGQVWCPPSVPRTDVNPRPLSPLVASNGLIGCFSADEKMIFAVAFDPYQELFQGVARCLHADFRIGGLKPAESKRIHGKIYLVPNDVPALLARYQQDFPQHVSK
jgi:hypothetical protein